ncbi:glucose-1-phosphate thymidylyltransferase [[Eubacterium] cellulosolvens]
MKSKGIILHGGHGTRLRPLTHTGPKQLIPIANKPISQYVLEDLRNSGIKDIAIILGGIFPDKVKEHYGDGGSYGINISYIHQSEPKGIAHAISLCEDFVGKDKFIVYLGDNILKGGIEKHAKKFFSNNYDAMVLLTKVKNPSQFGVAEFDTKKRLKKLIEKPKVPPSNYALTGIYFLSPIIFKFIKKLKPSWRGELEITDALQSLLSDKCNVGYDFVKDWWKDTGSPEDILDANRLVLDELAPKCEGKIEDASSAQGRMCVDKGVVIKKGSLIRGPCIIGKNSIIESGVYIGPYTSIGNNVKVKKGEIENSIIMDNCEIDVEERIVDSLIGPYSKIVSSDIGKPKGRRLILGEKSELFF